MTKSKC